MPTKIEVEFDQVLFTNLVKNKRKLKFFFKFCEKAHPLHTQPYLVTDNLDTFASTLC